MSRIKVLPVYPEYPDTFWSFKGALELMPGKRAVMPPTGLATVLAMLPNDLFEPQRIVDLNVEPLTDEHIRNCDVVFTSSMIVQEESHNEIAERAHRLGKKVVAGGPFPTSYSDRVDADYIVAGEAELVLKPFVRGFINGEDKRTWTEKDAAGNDLVQLTRESKPVITGTPLPRWDLLNLRQYNSAAVQYSRGCPFDCDFCDIVVLNGHESRTKTNEQMLAELDALYNAGHRGSTFIVDDNFIGNRKNVRELLPALIEWQEERGYPFSLFTEASLNLAWKENEDILGGMNRAGFTSIFAGIESPDEDVLKKMNKGQNTKQTLDESVERIQRAGMEVLGGFIIGSDGEKPGVFERMYDFIQRTGIVVPMPGLLTALRGTKLYKRLEKEGRLLGDSNGNNTHNLGFNFRTEMDESELIRGYKELITKLFEPKNYYERCRTLESNIGPNQGHQRANLEGIMTLGNSIRKQLFKSGGLEYAKYLAHTAIKHPSYFGEAVTHGVKERHFQRITEATVKADDFVPHIESRYERFAHWAEAIYSDSGRAAHKKLELISKRAEAVVRNVEKKYEKIHKDFRGRADVALDDFKGRVQELIDRYRPASMSPKCQEPSY